MQGGDAESAGGRVGLAARAGELEGSSWGLGGRGRKKGGAAVEGPLRNVFSKVMGVAGVQWGPELLGCRRCVRDAE